MRQLSETLRALLEEASHRKSNKGGTRSRASNAYSNAQTSSLADKFVASGHSATDGSMHEVSASTGKIWPLISRSGKKVAPPPQVNLFRNSFMFIVSQDPKRLQERSVNASRLQVVVWGGALALKSPEKPICKLHLAERFK